MSNHLENNYNHMWSIAICFMFIAIVVLLPDLALAQTTATGTQSVENVICRIVKALQGNVARGVAAFGIIFLGFSLFLGKISWGTALALGIGLGAIFGAQQIVNLMGGGSSLNCDSVS